MQMKSFVFLFLFYKPTSTAELVHGLTIVPEIAGEMTESDTLVFHTTLHACVINKNKREDEEREEDL